MSEISLKTLKKLNQKKYRDEYGLFFAEGEKLINDIPETYIAEFLLSAHYAKTRPDFEKNTNIPVRVLSDGVFLLLTGAKTPQGRIALCKKPKFKPFGSLCAKKPANRAKRAFDAPPLFVLLDRVQDPANVGAIARLSHACGVSTLFLSNGCADLFGQKAVAAAAASIFFTPSQTNADLLQTAALIKQTGADVYAAAPNARKTFYEADFKAPCAFILGSEGRGVSNELLSQARQTLCIPMPGGGASLNVSTACAALLYEALRQRLFA